MSDAPQIHVDRGRPVCPYCKDAVTGLAWLCPGCEAAHHAECMREHGRCATCAAAVDAAATEAVRPRAGGALASVRTALEGLGFSVAREGPEEVVAYHPAWRLSPMATKPFSVHALRVATLTADRLALDLERLTPDALAASDALVFYVADAVDRAADAKLAAGTAEPRDGRAIVAVAWTSDGRLTTARGLLLDPYGHHTHLARVVVNRVANPHADTWNPGSRTHPFTCCVGVVSFSALLWVVVRTFMKYGSS